MGPKLYIDNIVKYKDMEDGDLVKLAKNDDSFAIEFLLDKYDRFVVCKSTIYYLVGGDRDDLIQEGRIGLLKAIRDYDERKLVPFICFVEICIKRQVITAIKASNRKKHLPLNSYVSLNKNIYKEDSDRTLLDKLESHKVSDPMEVFINMEEIEKIHKKMTEILSDLEFLVLKSHLQGKSYLEISIEIDRDEKCIDNAMQRIKKKLTRDSAK